MGILLEEEADSRRAVEENQLADILRIARQEMADADRAAEEEALSRRARDEKNYGGCLVAALAERLGIIVPIERVRFVEPGDFGEWYPATEFAGLTFAYRVPSRRYEDQSALVLARRCVRGCGRDVWAEVSRPAELVDALNYSMHQHTFECTQPEPGYEIVELNPSPAVQYTAAIRLRRELQFERAKVKELAIRRILANKGVTVNGETFAAGSASAAEKLVEFDEGYAAHCAALTDAVIAEITARELLIAADGKPGKEDEEM